MADQILFAGGEPDSFTSFTGAMSIDAAAGSRDTEFSACAMALNANSIKASFFGEDGSEAVSDGTLWVSFCVKTTQANMTKLLETFDSSNRPSFRVRRALGLLIVECNTSATATASWSPVISTATFGDYLVLSFDQSAMLVSLFINGDFIVSGAIPSPKRYTEVSYAVFGESFSTFLSQVVISNNKQLVGCRLRTLKPIANGALAEMAGSYTSLNKTAINDTTAVVSNAPLQKSTYAYQDSTTPSGLELSDVWQWTRSKNDGTSPINLKPMGRLGGVNYIGPNMSGMSSGFNALPARWPKNPATSAKWNDATFNPFEWGMESAD